MSQLSRRSLFAALRGAPLLALRQPEKTALGATPTCACGWAMWVQRYDPLKGLETSNLGLTCSNRQCENFGKVFEMPMVPLREIRGVKSELAEL
jgi:hypothetical protein